MKHFGLLFLILQLNISYSQDTLREQNSVMYSKYYVIHENNSFEYYFHHCTGVVYGEGNIVKHSSKWEFVFDSLPENKQPEVICSSKGMEDSLTLVIRDFFVTDPSIPFTLQVGGKFYYPYVEPRIVVSKTDFNLKSPAANLDGVEINLPNLESCSEITILYHNPWYSYENGGVMTLNKKGSSLYYVEKIRYENEEKPWKKGKRKKFTYVYKFG